METFESFRCHQNHSIWDSHKSKKGEGVTKPKNNKIKRRRLRERKEKKKQEIEKEEAEKKKKRRSDVTVRTPGGIAEGVPFIRPLKRAPPFACLDVHKKKSRMSKKKQNWNADKLAQNDADHHRRAPLEVKFFFFALLLLFLLDLLVLFICLVFLFHFSLHLVVPRSTSDRVPDRVIHVAFPHLTHSSMGSH